MWQLLILLYFVFGTAYYLLRRVLAQKIPEYNRLVNAIFFGGFLLPAGAILAFLFPHNLHIGLVNTVLLLAGSLIYPIGYVVAFKANETTDVGIFTIISNLTPLVTITLALPLLHETLNAWQTLGAGLIVVSGVIAAFSQIRDNRRTGVSGVAMCVLYAVIIGVAITYERFMLSRVDFGAYLVYGWGAQIAWGIFLARKEITKISLLFTKDRQTTRAVLGMGLAGALRSVCFIGALAISRSASLISSSTNFLSVAVIFGAYIFLRERNHMLQKTAAVIIGIAGLLLIAR